MIDLSLVSGNLPRYGYVVVGRVAASLPHAGLRRLARGLLLGCLPASQVRPAGPLEEYDQNIEGHSLRRREAAAAPQAQAQAQAPAPERRGVGRPRRAVVPEEEDSREVVRRGRQGAYHHAASDDLVSVRHLKGW